MKPTFEIQNLAQCVKDSRARIEVARAQVARLEKWSEEIASAEASQAALSGEVVRMQQELAALFAELPSGLENGFAEALARAAEAEAERLEAADGADAKKPATK